jgi:hypothetical protein
LALDGNISDFGPIAWERADDSAGVAKLIAEFKTKQMQMHATTIVVRRNPRDPAPPAGRPISHAGGASPTMQDYYAGSGSRNLESDPRYGGTVRARARCNAQIDIDRSQATCS